MKNTMFISNDILTEALLKYQIERIDNEYPSTEDCNKQFKPNKQTQEKINKLIRMDKKPYFVLINTIGKRVACIIIVILIAMTTTVFSVKAFREPFINFIVETYEKFSIIIFNNSESKGSESKILTEYYEPTYIPDGYTKTDEEKLFLSYLCEYTDDNDNIIIFQQLMKDNANLSVDTEDTNIIKTFINKKEAIFFENKGFNNIIFSDDTYGFTITGNIEKSELVQVAESVKRIK